jgi:hypothetical protein
MVETKKPLRQKGCMDLNLVVLELHYCCNRQLKSFLNTNDSAEKLEIWTQVLAGFFPENNNNLSNL